MMLYKEDIVNLVHPFIRCILPGTKLTEEEIENLAAVLWDLYKNQAYPSNGEIPFKDYLSRPIRTENELRIIEKNRIRRVRRKNRE